MERHAPKKDPKPRRARAAKGVQYDAQEPTAFQLAKPTIDPLRIARAGALVQKLLASRAEDDPQGLLRRYYRSLEVAREFIKAFPESSDAIACFLNEVSIVPDLRPLLRSAVEVRAGTVEPPGELGSACPEIDQLNALILDGQGEMDWMRMSNEAVKKVAFGKGGLGRDLSKLIEEMVQSHGLRVSGGRPTERLPEELMLNVLRLYARGKELRVPSIKISDWKVVEQHLTLTPEVLAVVERVAAAFRLDRATTTLGGARLSEARAPIRGPWTPGTPLGEADFSTEGSYGEKSWRTQLERHSRDAFRPSDATIHHLLGLQEFELRTLILSKSDVPAEKLELFRICARAAELGYTGRHFMNGLQEEIRVLEPTQDAADVLRVICRLEGWHESDYLIGGLTLDSFAPTRGLPPAPLPREPGPSLGNSSVRATDFEGLVKKRDKRILTMSDRALENLYDNAFSTLLTAGGGDRDWNLGTLKVVAHAAETDVIAGDSIEDTTESLQSFLMGTLSAAERSDPELMAQLVRIVDALEIHEPTLRIAPGIAVDHFAPYVRAKTRMLQKELGIEGPVDRRRIEEPKELGSLGRMPDLDSKPNAARLAVSDEALLASIDREFRLIDWMPKWRTPHLFKVAARLMELSSKEQFQRKTRWTCYHFFEEHIVPKDMITAESMPWLIRMVRAYGAFTGMHPGGVMVEVAGSPKPIPLTEHPLYEKALAPHIDDVAELLQKAADRGAPEVRHGYVRQIVSGKEPRFELADILPALIARNSKPGITRNIDYLDNPAEVRSAFAEWNHLGVLAIFSAFLTQLDGAQIEQLLLEKGHDAQQAKTWSDIALRLRGLEEAQVGFVLDSVLRDPEKADFSMIELRLKLIESIDEDAIRTELRGSGMTTPLAHAQALLERALIEADGSPIRRTLFDLVSKLVDERLILPHELRRAASKCLGPLSSEAPEQWGLYADLVAPLLKAIEAYAGSASADHDPVSEIVRRAKDLAVFTDPQLVASMVLPRTYRADLAHALPLGAEGTADGTNAMRTALERLEELGRSETAPPRIPATAKRQYEWIEWAVRGQPISEDALVGLAAAYEAGWVSREVLASARNALPRDDVLRAWARVRSSDARAILEDRRPAQRLTSIPAVLQGPENVEGVTLARGARAPGSQRDGNRGFFSDYAKRS
jgi:hypothetical protein